MKSKFNTKLLILSLVTVLALTAAVFGFGLLFTANEAMIDPFGFIMEKLITSSLASIWNRHLVAAYGIGAGVMIIMSILWVTRQMYIKAFSLPNHRFKLWLVFTMIPALAICVITIPLFTFLYPLKVSKFIDIFWPWLLFPGESLLMYVWQSISKSNA